MFTTICSYAYEAHSVEIAEILSYTFFTKISWKQTQMASNGAVVWINLLL